MKRLTFAAILVLAFSFSAFGGVVQDFGKFTMNVLDGWTGTYDGANGIINRDDNTAQLVVSIASTRGASLERIARSEAADFARSGFKCVTKPSRDSDGDWSFDAVSPDGMKVTVIVTGESGGDYVMLMMSCVNGAEFLANDMMTMIETIRPK